jgi:hypothetical protein
VYEFTEADLKANRRGLLTQSQRELLRMTARGVRASSMTSVYVIVGFMFFGMCLILALYLQNEDTRAALFSNPLNLLVFPAIVLVIAVILIFVILLARWVSNRLLNAQLQVAEGKIRLDQEYSSNAGFTSYYVYVGRKRFGFTDDMSHTFKEGEKYRVYYVKASAYELIMSFERVEENIS